MGRTYWRLFTLGLWLGSTVFGGANAAYPVIRQKATALGWATGEEVDGLFTLSLLMPGPSFLNLWGVLCRRVGGFGGAVIGQVGLILPAFTLVLALPLLGRIEWLGARAGGATTAALHATAGLLIATGIEGMRKWRDLWPVGLGITGLALVLLGLHPLLALAVLMAAGAARSLLGSARKEAA